MKNLSLFILGLSTLSAFASAAELSKTDAQAIIKAVNNGQGGAQTNLPESELKGKAAKKYFSLKNSKDCKNWGYCPSAIEMEVAAEGKKFNVIEINWSNDGAIAADLYTRDGGQHFASVYTGESGDGTLKYVEN